MSHQMRGWKKGKTSGSRFELVNFFSWQLAIGPILSTGRLPVTDKKFKSPPWNLIGQISIKSDFTKTFPASQWALAQCGDQSGQNKRDISENLQPNLVRDLLFMPNTSEKIKKKNNSSIEVNGDWRNIRDNVFLKKVTLWHIMQFSI